MQGSRIIVTVIMLCVAALPVVAQQHERNGWLYLNHTQKLSEKIKLLADIQGRSADKYKYWNGLLLRAALSYAVSKNGDVGAGYAYFGEWEEEEQQKTYSREHRIFEQYQHQLKFARKTLNLRGRLEQRFKKDEGIKFSQRLRAYASLQAPLIANEDFSKGMYVKLQDEIFFNVQHKENVNGSLFDQHRPYIAVGYRASKKLDVELGYIRLQQKEDEGTFIRNTMQLMITTSF